MRGHLVGIATEEPQFVHSTRIVCSIIESEEGFSNPTRFIICFNAKSSEIFTSEAIDFDEMRGGAPKSCKI